MNKKKSKKLPTVRLGTGIPSEEDWEQTLEMLSLMLTAGN